MILGTSETNSNLKESFKEIDKKLKIYSRTTLEQVSMLNEFPDSFTSRKAETTENYTSQKMIENIQVIADQVLLQRFSPASVLITPNAPWP